MRVIAATNKNLEKEIAAGRFREDLYYRLNVIPFQVPPLRERREDIEILARRFVQEFCAESGERPRELTPECLAALEAHAWPGNVRELRNLIERLVIMTPGPSIDVADLPGHASGSPLLEDEEEGGTLEQARRGFEREYLLAKLREHGWNISRTAEAIGIARESLSRKIKTAQDRNRAWLSASSAQRAKRARVAGQAASARPSARAPRRRRGAREPRRGRREPAPAAARPGLARLPAGAVRDALAGSAHVGRAQRPAAAATDGGLPHPPAGAAAPRSRSSTSGWGAAPGCWPRRCRASRSAWWDRSGGPSRRRPRASGRCSSPAAPGSPRSTSWPPAAGRRAPCEVLLGARSAADLMGEADFAALGVALRIATEDGSRGERGLVTELLERALAERGRARVYTCGPTPMMERVAQLAAAAGLPCVVSLENHMACGFGVCLGCAAPLRRGRLRAGVPRRAGLRRRDDRLEGRCRERAVDTRVDLGGIALRNPVLTASGTFGYGSELAPFLDLRADRRLRRQEPHARAAASGTRRRASPRRRPGCSTRSASRTSASTPSSARSCPRCRKA